MSAPKTIGEVAERALDVLAERGWHQGGLVADPMGAVGPVCIQGAAAVGVFGSVWMPLGDELRMAAYRQFARALNAHLGDPRGGFQQWNDDPATAYEDVRLALKHVAHDHASTPLPGGVEQ